MSASISDAIVCGAGMYLRELPKRCLAASIRAIILTPLARFKFALLAILIIVGSLSPSNQSEISILIEIAGPATFVAVVSTHATVSQYLPEFAQRLISTRRSQHSKSSVIEPTWLFKPKIGTRCSRPMASRDRQSEAGEVNGDSSIHNFCDRFPSGSPILLPLA